MQLRVAIVHDWLAGMYGAEQVVEELVGLFEPAPDIYTFHAVPVKLSPGLRGARIRRQSRLAALPGLRGSATSDGHWRWLLPLMPRFFESLDLDGYDLVISSSHACAAGAKPPPGVPHLVYCHTPMRYAWMPDAERSRFSAAEALAMRAVRRRLREWDRRAAQRPTAYIANSTAVAARIADFYGRAAVVVHPPVALDELAGAARHDPRHFLWVNRFVAYKRPLDVVRAFAALPELRLTLVGVGPLRDEVLAYVASHRLTNIEVRGWIERAELLELYRECGAFVHIGEEDFGISMAEAQGAGLPVLALDMGGATDIVDPRSGALLPVGFTVAELTAAAAAMARAPWDREAIRRGASRFSSERFRAEITDVIDATLARERTPAVR